MDNPMYNAILRWSLSQTDATEASQAKPMKEDDRKWLGEALNSVVVDQVKLLKDHVATLKTYTESKDTKDASAQESALDAIDDLCTGIDLAMDLHKVGGLKLVIALLSAAQPGIRWRAAQVLATASQNNPKVQQWCRELNAIRHLLDCLEVSRKQTSEEHGMIVVKCVFALSSLLGNDAENQAAFVKCKGIGMAVQVLRDHPSTKAKRKCITLLAQLIKARTEYAEESRTFGLVSALMANVGHEDIHLRENSLKVLLEMIKQGGAVKAKKYRKTIVPVLDARLSGLLPADEEFQDEVVLLKETLAVLKPASTPDSDSKEESVK